MSSLPLLLVALLALFGACRVSAQSGSGTAAAAANASLCLLFFSDPNNVEYPWSVAVKMTVTYVPGTIPNTVVLQSGTGSRIYYSKYSDKVTRTVTLSPPSASNPSLLYTNGTAFDFDGILYTLDTPVQFPGQGALSSSGVCNVFRAPYGITEDPSFVGDNSSVSITSSIPGFVPITISCPGNPNCNNINTDTCLGTISPVNGGVARPSSTVLASFNKSPYTYSYFITNNQYSVTANLTLTIDTTTGFKRTALGDYYLTVTAITGTRVYSQSGSPLVNSTVNAINKARPATNQFLFPLTYYQQSYIYTANSAPYLDAGGIGYIMLPASYADGQSGNQPRNLETWGVYVYSAYNDIELIESNNDPSYTPILYSQQQILHGPL